jgi:glutathione synthase/RimK-type ligase-like ATP-grasp enzyme
MTNILVTGSGGSGGISFIRALKLAEKQQKDKLFIVGTDHNPHFLNFSEADIRVVSPRHDDPVFLQLLLRLIKEHDVAFVHPHPSSEARVVAENLQAFNQAGVKTYLPNPKAIMPDKLEIHRALSKKGVRVPKTLDVHSLDDIDVAFRELGKQLWIRAKRGAGGRLGLKVDSAEEARHWVELNTLQHRCTVGDFVIHEYLPGRDLAFDSLWYNGRLITSYGRERLEYFLKHISLSGITGTPTIARTIVDEKVNEIGVRSVTALDPKPHGFYSTDIKEDAEGNCVVTEVDGKWHTTAPLWGYAFAKALNKPELNLTYQYLKLALGNSDKEVDLPTYNLFPADHYLVRQLDAGVILEHEGKSWRIV